MPSTTPNSLRLTGLTINGRPRAIRIAGGRIVDLGPGLDAHPREEHLDLGGRAVLPGLRDAHTHMTLWSTERRHAALNDALRAATSAVAAADAVAAHAPPGTAIVRGAGFAPSVWDDVPTAALLERSLPGRRVVLVSADAHTSWWSPAALAAQGIVHDDGVLRERESWDALQRLDVGTDDEVDAAIDAGLAAAAARGVTAIVDYEMGGAIHGWIRRADRESALPVRVTSGIMEHELDDAVHRGWRTGLDLTDGSGMLSVGALKLFSDGALGSRTAHCDEHYVGEPDNHGRVLADTDDLERLVRRAHRHGLTTTIHAIGDAANRSALDAFARVGVGGRIEHAQLVHRDDIARFRIHGVIASIQPSHAVEDRDLVARWWSDRTTDVSPLRSLLDAGAQVEFGSDAPVSELDPWRAIQAAVTRTFDDRPPWLPDESIGLRTALALSRSTTIEVGAPADIVILDADPAETPACDLAEMPVHATMCAGRWTHRS